MTLIEDAFSSCNLCIEFNLYLESGKILVVKFCNNFLCIIGNYLII